MESGTTVQYAFKMIFDLRILLFRLQSQNGSFLHVCCLCLLL